MDFILPSQNDSVITTPLHILGNSLYAGVVLAELFLKVTAYDPNFAVVCVQCDEAPIWRNAYMPKGSILQHPIFGICGVNDIDGLANG